MTTLPCICWIFCRTLVMDRWNVADALQSPKGMRRHSNKPNSQANAVFLLSHFFSGICQKAHAKSMLVKIFAMPILDRLSWVAGRHLSRSRRLAVGSHNKSEVRPSFSLPLLFHWPMASRKVGLSQGLVSSSLLDWLWQLPLGTYAWHLPCGGWLLVPVQCGVSLSDISLCRPCVS